MSSTVRTRGCEATRERSGASFERANRPQGGPWPSGTHHRRHPHQPQLPRHPAALRAQLQHAGWTEHASLADPFRARAARPLRYGGDGPPRGPPVALSGGVLPRRPGAVLRDAASRWRPLLKKRRAAAIPRVVCEGSQGLDRDRGPDAARSRTRCASGGHRPARLDPGRSRCVGGELPGRLALDRPAESSDGTLHGGDRDRRGPGWRRSPHAVGSGSAGGPAASQRQGLAVTDPSAPSNRAAATFWSWSTPPPRETRSMRFETSASWSATSARSHGTGESREER
jgi:hypothetical protein